MAESCQSKGIREEKKISPGKDVARAEGPQRGGKGLDLKGPRVPN